MLNTETAKKIGINACIDKLGRDFVLAHKDFAVSAYGENDNSVFCFVGVDNGCRSQNSDHVLFLDSHSKFPFRVSCDVGLEDGTPRFIECVLPPQ